MDRRRFITTTGVGAAAAAAGALASGSINTAVGAQAPRPAAKPWRKALVQLGSNANAYDAADLTRIARFGVKSIVGNIQIADPTGMKATPAEYAKLRELPDKHGIQMRVYHSHVPVNAILRGLPERVGKSRRGRTRSAARRRPASSASST